MARGQLIILISTLLLLPLAFPLVSAHEYGYAPAKPVEKKVNVVVEAMVYCQSCEHVGTWSLTNAKPLPSAKVSVICKDYKGRVSFYKVFEADKGGYVYAELKGYEMSHRYVEHPLQACKVRLVASPDKKCSLFTNVNDGMYGAPLRYENKRFQRENYEIVVYAGGPVAFRPNQCPPQTHY